MSLKTEVVAPRVSGMHFIEDTSFKGCFFYANDIMIQNKMFIFLSNLDEDGILKTTIKVSYVNPKVAYNFTLYSGDHLEAIQSYGIIKDVFEIFNDGVLSSFFSAMASMSKEHTSSLIDNGLLKYCKKEFLRMYVLYKSQILKEEMTDWDWERLS
ncbi:hypothetical protein [Viridibacillus arvi]|uniref:hypothetical protein n=1 Tax=Viridibacillus arvi TaxID=263475 RepID=UPI0034CD2D94